MAIPKGGITMIKLLAFDYGASSGRGILGSFDGEVLKLDEVHRFSNDPVTVNGTFYWDILRLYHELKQGVVKCVKSGSRDVAGIGIDTWGVDFGLIDATGQLLGNPYHYRDNRTDGMMEAAQKVISRREIYEQTGTQFQKFNTLYQLLSMKLSGSPLLEKADKMLFIPDLLNYFLTGIKASEFTIASTSQMYSYKTGGWAKDMLEKLEIPTGVLAGIIDAGTVLGSMKRDVAGGLGLGDTPVIAVAGHDTGSAVVSVPAAEGKYAYLSSGTWSLLGVEIDSPIINETTFKLNYTNEGGINRTVRLLKNIMGLWIYQECKRYWDKSGEAMSFDELEEAAAMEKPFNAFIDPDNEVFYSPGNMPDKIAGFCKSTGQKLPESKGAIVRCIMESLALKYRMAVEGLEEIIGYKLPVIHIVGGGCKNTVLCQFAANATGKRVVAGPIEATAIGNLTTQLIALGKLKDLKEARELVRRSFPMVEYVPVDRGAWDEAYNEFRKYAE